MTAHSIASFLSPSDGRRTCAHCLGWQKGVIEEMLDTCHYIGARGWLKEPLLGWKLIRYRILIPQSGRSGQVGRIPIAGPKRNLIIAHANRSGQESSSFKEGEDWEKASPFP
ncbi:45 kDa calcium-binding protein [Platysternon megacephalum]|uniref:45 kDa calcium-binding protein n=1 Tax=Platysternon megacephalum TaxID=55544 RepID=A0A4D9ESX3_9SAUR|nr:45 kDa calcium-binding protein [Platysternon megacephalum]